MVTLSKILVLLLLLSLCTNTTQQQQLQLQQLQQLPPTTTSPQQQNLRQEQQQEEQQEQQTYLKVLWDHSIVLDPRFVLSWGVDLTHEIIHIQVIALSSGFVAFGLSNTGTMEGADGYVGRYKDGVGVVEDFYLSCISTSQPGIPICADDTLGGTNDVLWSYIWRTSDGQTCMQFSRKFTTNDSYDIPITNQTMTVLWSMSPQNSDKFEYHTAHNRGKAQINFFTGEHSYEGRSDQWLLVIHGTVMFVMWNIITPISVLYARYLAPKRNALRVHKILQQVVLSSSIPMFVIAFYTVKEAYRTTHSILGLVFLALCSLQGYSGTAQVFVFPPWRSNGWRLPKVLRKMAHAIHPHLGRLLVLCSIPSVWTGMLLLVGPKAWFPYVFGVWNFTLFVFFGYQEFRKR